MSFYVFFFLVKSKCCCRAKKMEIILCLIYCFAVIYGLYKLYICYHCSEEDGDIEFQSISEQIEHLNELREQLQTVKEMITDVSICSPYDYDTNRVRKVKTDKIDALKIASYALDKWMNLRKYEPAETVRKILHIMNRQ